MYGWTITKLINDVIKAVMPEGTEEEKQRLRHSLRDFLNHVYFNLRNLGATSADRALNFAVTNLFQGAQALVNALAEGKDLDTIGVEKSPFCRMDSDCWDVLLRFFDPENNQRARMVSRYTVDVSDLQPVTLGEVRTWREAR